jgi:hypothetical protein
MSQLPTWSQLRDRINTLAVERGIMGGVPLPIEGLKLTVEPRYPWRGLNGAGLGEDEPEELPSDDDAIVRNCWRDVEHGRMVYVCQDRQGVFAVKKPLNWPQHRHKLDIAVLGVASSPAWSIEAETMAMEKLRSHLTEHRFRQYVLCGQFLETSKRSGVTYLFRKLRPTLAMKTPVDGGNMKILAALCMHPIAYYGGSFAGCMVPTDDVVAHLLLMRADEKHLWRKANQHSIWDAESGV